MNIELHEVGSTSNNKTLNTDNILGIKEFLNSKGLDSAVISFKDNKVSINYIDSKYIWLPSTSGDY